MLRAEIMTAPEWVGTNRFSWKIKAEKQE